MLGGIYAVLAIAGWVSLCALIAWFVGSFIDFAAQLFDDEDGKVADAWGEVVRLPDEMRTSQRIGSHRASAGPSGTNVTHSVLFSNPPSSCGERKYNG
jgi:hypothetical protein